MTRRLDSTFALMFDQLLTFGLDHLYLSIALAAGLALLWRYHPRGPKTILLFFGLPLLLWVEISVLNVIRQDTHQRMVERENSPYTTVDSPSGGDTRQYAPTAAFEEVTTRQESLTFSDQMFQRVGLEALPGWNGTRWHRSQGIKKIEDRLERTPHATFLKRDIVFSNFRPIAFDLSKIDLKLDFVPDSVAYQADFKAEYLFTNPLSKPAKLRFNFPLPSGSGTLSEFRVTVNGESSSASWEGLVDAGEQVRVNVHYQNLGKRSWSYRPTGQRDSISKLDLHLISDNRLIKFRRNSLFPTSSESGHWEWSLRDVITSQDISLVFPSASKREAVIRLLQVAPLALMSYFLLLFFWETPDERRLALATLAYSGGFLLTGYLSTYLPLTLATLAGCSMGAALPICWRGRRAVLPGILGCLVPVAFCWPGSTGLSLGVLGLATLVLFAHRLPNRDTNP